MRLSCYRPAAMPTACARFISGAIKERDALSFYPLLPSAMYWLSSMKRLLKTGTKAAKKKTSRRTCVSNTF